MSGSASWAQSVEYGQRPIGQNLGSFAITIDFPVDTEVGSIKVLTMGVSGKDFKAAGGNCSAGTYAAGSSCTLKVSFVPTAPGLRMGALVLYDTSVPHNAIITRYLSGVGVGPAVGFGPSQIRTIAGIGDWYSGLTGDNVPALSAIVRPRGLAQDGAGNIYISEAYNNRVRKVDIATGLITTVAGNSTSGYSGDGGFATNAQLNFPAGIALDGAGNLYIADDMNYRIRRVDAATGIITTVAGNGDFAYNGDNIPATAASIYYPSAVVVDGAANLYIADSYHQRIRKVTPDGIITTVAGNGGTNYNGDGIAATAATLWTPSGLTLDATGNLYISDSLNNRVRKVDASTGIITTIAGTGMPAYGGDGGPATSASLNFPFFVTVDASGSVYIDDLSNNRIRKVSPSGLIETVAGTGVAGFNGDNIPAQGAQLNRPAGVMVDGAGNLYISDEFSYRLRKVYVSDPPALTFPSTNVGSVSTAQDVTVHNGGNAQLTINQISTAAHFSLGGPGTTCSAVGQVLDAANSCVLGIQFAPQAGGAISGSVVLTDDTLNVSSSTQTINLSGTGVQVPTYVAFGSAPSATVPLGGNAGTVSVEVRDVLDAVVTGSSASVTLTVVGPGTYAQTYSATASAGVATFDLSTIPLNLAGTYTYTATSDTLASAIASQIVSKGTPSITWAASATITFGTNLTGVLNASATPVTGTIAYTLNGYPVTALDVLEHGSYTLEATFTPDDSTNYGPASVTLALEVNPALLTVTAENKSMTYGGAVPMFTASYNGFVNGEDSTVVTGAASLTTTATSTSNVGTYAITAAQGTLAAENYEFAFVDGSLTVDKAGLTVTANNKTKTYGTANPTLDGVLTGAVQADGITASYTTAATETSAVGDHAITSVLVDPNNKLANYTVTSTDGTLTITKAALSVVANDKTRAYGVANPTLDGVLTGVASADGITASYTTVATSASAIGAYTITPSLVDPNNKLANYTVTSTDGTLTITKAALSVVANNKRRPYGAANALDGVLTGAVPADGITANYTTTATEASAIGDYPITPLLVDPNNKLANYTVTSTDGTLTIIKAALSVVANSKTRAYGAANPTLDGTITGLVNDDVITAQYATVATQTSDAGTYPITASLADPGNKLGNYAVTNASGTLTITAAATTTAIASSKQAVNLPGSLTLTATVTSVAGAPSGTVTFYLGAASLGTATLDNTGKATLTVQNPTAVGKSTVSAKFEGSLNYAASTSPNLTQYDHAAAPDYTLSATPTALSLRQGESGTVQITLTPINGFNGNVTFACSGLAPLMGCQFTPSQLTGNLDNTPVKGTLTITTTAPARSVVQPSQSSSPLGMVIFSMSSVGVMGLVFAGDRSKRSQRVLVAICGALVLMLLLSSCGSPNQFASAGATPPGTISTTVVATATAGTTGAAPNHDVQVQITIMQ